MPRPIVANAKALAEELKAQGLDLVTGGTDNHLLLVDLRPKKLTGKVAEARAQPRHLTCNKNAIPFDPEKPMVTSGVRLGTPAGTTRGFGDRRVPRGRHADRRGAGRPRRAPTTPDANAAVEERRDGQGAGALPRFPIYPG